MGMLCFMTAGSVDDGKSTLIGRLFHDAGLILDDQMKAISKKGLNLAYFTDGLKEEREQGITIDVAYRYFETVKRKFIVADAPGHREFTRNMVTGATHADAVLVLVDASRGVSEQTRRHIFLARWLGVKNILVLINKMDLLGYSEEKFNSIKNEINDLGELNVIPISALNGENITENSTEMPWFKGPHLFEWLHSAPGRIERANSHLHFPVQIATESEVLGTLKSGQVSVGDKLSVNGSNETVTVKKISTWPLELETASAGMAVRMELDKCLSRGDILVDSNESLSASKTWKFEWCYLMEDEMPLGQDLTLRYRTRAIPFVGLTVASEFDLDLQKWIPVTPSTMQMNKVYDGALTLGETLFAEENGNVAIIDNVTGRTVAAGKLRKIL